jgi:hypothetical protein
VHQGDRRRVDGGLEVNDDDGVLEVDDRGRLEVDNGMLFTTLPLAFLVF